METQLADLAIITFNIARGRTFEQALRVDRPPSSLRYCTLSFSPATQGQRCTDPCSALDLNQVHMGF